LHWRYRTPVRSIAECAALTLSEDHFEKNGQIACRSVPQYSFSWNALGMCKYSLWIVQSIRGVSLKNSHFISTLFDAEPAKSMA